MVDSGKEPEWWGRSAPAESNWALWASAEKGHGGAGRGGHGTGWGQVVFGGHLGKGKFQSEAGERPRPVRAINGEEEARWALCAVSTRMHYHKWEKVSGVCRQPELLVKGEVLTLDAELEGYWEIDVGI